MDCRLCQKEIDAYLEGKPDPDLKVRIEAHLMECKKCNELYRIQALAERVIAEEKKLTVNPFFATRVMAQIEKNEAVKLKVAHDILRPALISVSLAAAIFAGVMIGSIPLRSQSDKSLPVELTLIDDESLESIDLLSID